MAVDFEEANKVWHKQLTGDPRPVEQIVSERPKPRPPWEWDQLDLFANSESQR
jgi:hypothetical protein